MFRHRGRFVFVRKISSFAIQFIATDAFLRFPRIFILDMRLFQLTLLACLVSKARCFQPLAVNPSLISPWGKVTAKGRQQKILRTRNQKTKQSQSLKAASSSATSEEWTAKRIWNANWFRTGALLLVLGLAGATQQSPVAKLSTQVAAAIHLLAFGTWFGTVFYTTFIAGLTMFKNLPRQTFGTLQSKLFPKYFLLCSITIVLQVSMVTSGYFMIDLPSLSPFLNVR